MDFRKWRTRLALFLAVVGPSGSGKSSVVRAGLIPALRRGELAGSEQWLVVELLPGVHPLEELEAVLLRIAVNPPSSLLEQLKEENPEAYAKPEGEDEGGDDDQVDKPAEESSENG